MLIYKYKSIDKQGDYKCGSIVANNEKEAFSKLQKKNLQPLQISRQYFVSQKVSLEDILMFFLHVSFQLKCGSHIDESIDNFIEFHKDNELSATLIQISEDLKNGETISEAFKKHCSFNPVIIGLLRAAESTGCLAETISSILNLLQLRYSWQTNLRGIISYPIFIALIAVIIMLVSSHVLGPQVVELIKNYGNHEVPFLTTFAVDILPMLSNIIAGIFLIAIVAIAITLSNKKGKNFVLQMSYSVPVISKIMKKIELWHVFEILHISYIAKLDFLDAFDLSCKTIQINQLKKQFVAVRNNILEGHKIATSFSKAHDIPMDIVMAIFVGEEGNSLEQTFKHVSKKIYDELVNDIKKAGDMLSISLTLFTGMIFIFILCSLFQPIYNYIGMAGA